MNMPNSTRTTNQPARCVPLGRVPCQPHSTDGSSCGSGVRTGRFSTSADATVATPQLRGTKTVPSSHMTRAGCVALPADGAAPRCQVVDPQHDERPEDGEQPGPQVEETAKGGVEDVLADDPADERADDAENGGQDDAAAIAARHDHLGDGADDQAQNDPRDDAHDVLPSVRSAGWLRLDRFPGAGCAHVVTPQRNTTATVTKP